MEQYEREKNTLESEYEEKLENLVGQGLFRSGQDEFLSTSLQELNERLDQEEEQRGIPTNEEVYQNFLRPYVGEEENILTSGILSQELGERSESREGLRFSLEREDQARGEEAVRVEGLEGFLRGGLRLGPMSGREIPPSARDDGSAPDDIVAPDYPSFPERQPPRRVPQLLHDLPAKDPIRDEARADEAAGFPSPFPSR